MTHIMAMNNLFLTLSFTVLFLFILLPFHKWISRLLSIRISQIILLLTIPVILAFLAALTLGVQGLLFFFMAFFIAWAFLFVFSVDRRYPYVLALIFLAVTPFFLILKMDVVAEYSAILSYLALVAGVTKDLLYEKLFN